MPIEGADRLVGDGWDAIAAADFESARSCFERALARGESAEALDGLSQAIHFLGDYDEATRLKERAFVAYREAGEPARAADAARWLAFLHATFRGDYAVASGWIARAESVLEDVE